MSGLDIRYRWTVTGQDENGDTHDLSTEFIATVHDANVAAKAVADHWEQRTGGLILRLTMERRGRVVP